MFICRKSLHINQFTPHILLDAAVDLLSDIVEYEYYVDLLFILTDQRCHRYNTYARDCAGVVQWQNFSFPS